MEPAIIANSQVAKAKNVQTRKMRAVTMVVVRRNLTEPSIRVVSKVIKRLTAGRMIIMKARDLNGGKPKEIKKKDLQNQVEQMLVEVNSC